MEFLILVVLLIALVIILRRLSDKTQEMHARFNQLNQEIRELKSTLSTIQAQQPEAAREASPTTVPLAQPTASAQVFTPPAPSQATNIPAAVELFTTSKPAEKLPVSSFDPTPQPEQVTPNIPAVPAFKPAPIPAEPQLNFLQRFLQNNPDLEKFIGENLINKIGIAILVLGIGYFVKFAIDQDWINEIGRVFIGILAGGLLIGLAHRLRHTLPAFSSVLVGGGLAVLYFTIAIAFHEYALFSQTAAFLIMVVITGFSILLSVSYNRVELAVIAIIGGFATPFMLSTGEGNYQMLFIYILILNVGMLVLAYLKGWRIINFIAYGFTIILYGGWLSTRVAGVKDAPYVGALIFGTLFYIIFFLMNIINNLKEKARFSAADISILLSNTFLYFGAGMLVLGNLQSGLYRGLFTVAIAVFNFGFAFVLFRNQKADRNLIYLLIGLVVTFISLAVPIQLEGNYITMFWALEAVLLLWLAQKSGLRLVSVGSVVVLGLMLISLVMDWLYLYLDYTPQTKNLPVLLNKAFITSFISILSLIFTRYLLQKQTEPIQFRWFSLPAAGYARTLRLILTVVLYFSLALELSYQLNIYVASAPARSIITGAYNLAFISGLFLFSRYQRQPAHLAIIMLLGLLGLVAYITIFSSSVMDLLESHLLYNAPGMVGFYMHYLSLLLVGLIMFFLLRNRQILVPFSPKAPNLLLWLLAFVLVYAASAELLYHVIYFKFPATNLTGLSPAVQTAAYERFEQLIRQSNKVGFPILWGICAFALMYVGLQQKNKTLRIISLSLFTLTLLKLFIYDIRGISEGGKIAAFISLGVLLLVISFMYQNIKRLILADETTPPVKE
ncbi:DUF2339 domain-containing protein [Adhaeribacter rhizoryzae]|uniref:DUF2339 domain-containing protein n=1 Tax=Adhaeribacter rhizoryzae TaxID=2607907 RepID=A0A5M6DC75_9BACT|nr:DUF2339 domain-containing protein [Adhaeribacter rhizoryzae]KAA5544066.1 DUF2339 domain-containing protein [Adhaeribacter rhizoryzae]